MKEDIKELIDIANNDLEEGKDTFNKGKYLYTCYFSQQAVEKYLKAYLLYKKGEYPFTHSISYLLKECINLDKDFEYMLNLKVQELERYYIHTRYPSILKISKEEAEEAINIAEKVKEFIYKKLNI